MFIHVCILISYFLFGSFIYILFVSCCCCCYYYRHFCCCSASLPLQSEFIENEIGCRTVQRKRYQQFNQNCHIFITSSFAFLLCFFYHFSFIDFHFEIRLWECIHVTPPNETIKNNKMTIFVYGKLMYTFVSLTWAHTTTQIYFEEIIIIARNKNLKTVFFVWFQIGYENSLFVCRFVHLQICETLSHWARTYNLQRDVFYSQ